MSLTPDDVLNKRFQTTKFRDGYEQDEVDDFLDEVVVEFRRLLAENEDLKAQLQRAQERVKELEQSGGRTTTAAVAPSPAPAPVQTAPAPVRQAPAAVQAQGNESDESTSLLQLARRLHDEHVQEGIEKRDKLIAEARTTATRIVAEAEQRKTQELNELTAKKASLQSDIKELETFESEYRNTLKSFLTAQLKDLEQTGSLAAESKNNSGSSFKSAVRGDRK